ncbi:hypothetical protein, partial [Salmonella enterica]
MRLRDRSDPPYATPLPLFSPPLIHADRALTEHQQQQIRKILES